MSSGQQAMEARGRKRCSCRQCANADKHPCGFVLSVAIPFALDERQLLIDSDRPETASENPNGFVGKCDVPTGPVPTDSDRAKAKAALGELGEVTTAVEAVARLLADEREPSVGPSARNCGEVLIGGKCFCPLCFQIAVLELQRSTADAR